MRSPLKVAGIAGLLLSVVSIGSYAAITATYGWSRETPPGVKIGAAYLELVNTGPGDDRLVEATSPVAGTVEIHTSINDQGVMKMREQSSVELAEGEAVSFAPGGLHFMLLELREPLTSNMRFPLHLRFENAATVMVDVSVRGLSDTAAPAMDHSMHQGMAGAGMARDHSMHQGMAGMDKRHSTDTDMDMAGMHMDQASSRGMQPSDHVNKRMSSMHHLHVMSNQAVAMAAAGASLSMLGAMNMAPGVDGMAAEQGSRLFDRAATTIDALVDGAAMQALHRQGATPEADPEMNYTHLSLQNAKGVLEVLGRMPSMSATGDAAAMTMHHLHIMIAHAVEMASQGSNLVMLGQMGMAPDVDTASVGHGRRMIADAGGMVALSMSGPAMIKLHQQGMDANASTLMAYTHELGRVAMAHIDLLARMSPVGAGTGAMQHHGGGPMMHRKGGRGMHHQGGQEMHHQGGHEMHHQGGQEMHHQGGQEMHHQGGAAKHH